MFKSIDYKLYLYLFLLIITVSLTTYFFIDGQYIYGSFFIFLAIIEIIKLYTHYNRFNKNILFLLNALDNGDYAFHFSTTHLSRREKELNKMMNRIKEILMNAKQEVIANEKFLSLIIEQVPTGIVVLDENNNVKGCNQMASDILGLPIFTHINQLKIIDKSLPDLFRKLETNSNQQIKIINEIEEIQILLKASTIKIKQKDLRIISLNNIAEELEEKEMDSWIKLIRKNKQQKIKKNHHITTITQILFYQYQTQEIENNKSLKTDTIDSLQTIHNTSKDLISFVKSYREFSKVSNPQITSFHLDSFIKSTLKLEEAELSQNNIILEIENAEDTVIHGDSALLGRVFINLIKNAIESLHNQLDKTIKIKSNVLENNIQIDISDNGTPIPEDMVNDIFIPFFTTKQGGSGIGLSVSRYIMRLQGGTLKHNFHNGWTTFSMILPKPKGEDQQNKLT